jgi:hypothetical protein
VSEWAHASCEVTDDLPPAGTAITHVLKWYDFDDDGPVSHVGVFRGHVKADARIVTTRQFVVVDDEESRNMSTLLNAWNEGVAWIRGRYEDNSLDAHALLAAYKLWASAA